MAVAGVLAVTAVVVRAVAADANGCGSGVSLPVAVAPEFAPAVREAATRWEKTGPEVNGKCVRVEVRATSPAEVAGALAARVAGAIDVAAKPVPAPPESALPAVWIPDSSAWLTRMGTVDRSVVAATAPSLASSPVVFAVPESLAQSLGVPLAGGAPALLGKVLQDAQGAIRDRRAPDLPLGLVDPRRDTASLAGAMIIRDAVVTDASKVPNLIAVYRLVNRTKAPDLAGLQQAFQAGLRVAPMAEHSVLSYNGKAPTTPLAAVSMPAGGPMLDYPYAMLGGRSQEVESAAGKFRTALTSADLRNLYARHGFRGPDGVAGSGFPVGHGVSAEPVVGTVLSDSIQVTDALGYWTAATSPSRALALIDVSASMNLPLGGTVRLAVMQQAAVSGLALFTDSSALGIWTYSSGHTELAPIQPLTPANRQNLNARIASVRTDAVDESALFLTLRDAYRTMTAQHVPEVANRIIVMTDGRSSTRGVAGLEALGRELESIGTVTKPIEVTLIGVGPDADMGALNEIARMTGGVAKQILEPSQIQSVLLDALLD